MQTAIFVAFVVLALVAIVLSGRTKKVPLRLVTPTAEGLVPVVNEGGDAPIPWSDVYRVTLLVKRRFAGSTRFVFEMLSESGGTTYVDGSQHEASEQFLAECHRLPGFDHDTLVATLSRNTSADVVVFSR